MHEKRHSSENLAAYQAKYSDPSRLVRFANRRFEQAIDLFLDQIRFDRLLDAGCGEGVVLERIKPRAGVLQVGADIDPARVALAGQARKLNNLLTADAHHLPFADDSFDVVLMLEVFEHVGEPQHALDEIQRVTRKYLLASVPNEPWWRLGNMARGKYLREWGNTPEHINHWSSAGFKRFLERRFEVIALARPMLWTFALAIKRP